MKKTLKEIYYGDPPPRELVDASKLFGGDYALASRYVRLDGEKDKRERKKLLWMWIKQGQIDFKQYSELMDVWNVRLI